MTEHRARVAELLADYRRSREQLAAVHAELGAVSASASGAGGLVTATVGARGVLTALEIDEDAYRRLSPAQLAAHIVRATASAAAAALRGAGEIVAPTLGGHADPQALLLGTADLTADELVATTGPHGRADDADAAGAAGAEPDDSDFADQSWLDDTEWSKAR